MRKDKRKGYVTLSIEMPIEVADWLAANAERLGNELRKERSDERREYLIDLGRTGYRQLQRAGVGTCPLRYGRSGNLEKELPKELSERC